jgi:Putative zinc-finger
MTREDHVLEELGGYVLGALEPAEEVAVREHLTHCARCSAEHARLAGLPELLSLAEGLEGAQDVLPAAVEERVLDAVAREQSARRRSRRGFLPRGLLRPRFLAVAAATAAAALLVLALVPRRDHPPYQVALRPVAGATASGRAQLDSVSGGTTLHMWVHDLPADPSVVYEVRCDAPDWSASAGTFRVDAHGAASVVLTTAARRGEYDSIRVVRRSRRRTTDVMTAQLD